jgi:hypothetical protein
VRRNFQLAVILEVVEDTGVAAAGEDGGVGEAARAGAGELVDVFGLDLPFSDAGFQETEDAAEACLGDIAGLLDEGDFLIGFDNAELVDERGEALVAVEREALPALLHEAGVARLDGDVAVGVLVGGDVDVIGLHGEDAEGDFEGVVPVDSSDACAFGGLLFGEFRAFPDGDGVVALADEENLPCPLSGPSGCTHCTTVS